MLAVSLLFVYAPTFFIEFGIHNDYRVKDIPDGFKFWPLTNYLRHTESMHLCYVGRPLNAILFNIHQGFFEKVNDFAYGRVVSFAVAAVCAVVLYLFLRRECHAKASLAFASAFSVFTLPSCYTYVIWQTNFVPGIFNVFFATCTYGYFHYCYDRCVRERWKMLCFVAIPTVLLLVASCLIYPPSAFTFLLFPFALALFAGDEAWRRSRQKVAWAVSLVAGAMATYYVVNKGILFPLFRWYFKERFRSWDPASYEFGVKLSLQHIMDVLADLARIGLRLWDTDIYSPLMPILLVAVFGVSAGVALRRGMREPGGRPAWALLLQRWGTGTAIVSLCLAPILVSPGGFVAYRIVFVTAALLSLLFVNALWKIATAIASRRTASYLMAFVIVMVAITSQRTLVNMAMDASIEYNFFRNRLIRLIHYDKHPVRIQIRTTPEEAVFVDYPLYFDLAYLACNHGLMDSIVHFITEELHIRRSDYVIECYDVNQRLPEAGNDVLQLDMNDLLYRKALKYGPAHCQK